MGRNRGEVLRNPTCFAKAAASAESGIWGDIRLPTDVQKRRIAIVIERELTPLQRECLLEHLAGRTQAEIAADRGVNRSTVCRTVHRAINRLQRFLRY